MRRSRYWGIGVALWAGVLLAPAYADEACTHGLVASVPAELGPHDELLIHAKIDDQPVLLGVDTGAAVSVMFERPLARLGIGWTPARANVTGLDGRVLDEITTVPSLALGSAVSRGTEFPVSPSRAGEQSGEAGLFGADYLRNYDLEIDLADGKVNLFAKDHCPGRVVYWANSYNATDVHISASGQIAVPVELDGQSMEAILDTGASDTTLQFTAARGKFGIGQDSPGVERVGTAGGIGGRSLETYRYAFKSLKFGDLLIHNPQIDLAAFRDSITTLGSHIHTENFPDMLIGMSLLRHLRLYIAYGERRIYYTVAAPAPAPVH